MVESMAYHFRPGLVGMGILTCISVSCSASSTAPPDDPVLADLSGDYLGQQPPGDVPAVFAPGLISGQRLHATPSFSPDGNEIYWAVSGSGPGASRIWHSRRIGNQWTEAAPASFSESEQADNPAVSSDGQSLFFNSDRPVGGEARERIWRVERRSDGSWSDPSPVDPVINDYPLHWQVSLDEDGGLYFGSERDPSQGSDDIFHSEFRDGHFQMPENLGQPINTQDHESMPFIDPRERFLLFSRQSFGGSAGLFVSRRNTDGSWADPINVTLTRPEVQGECPQLTPDGRFLFFLRYENGAFNVYWIDARFLRDLLGL